MQRELESLKETLPHIEKWTRKIAAIEENMYPDQCTLLIKFLKDLMMPLKALKEMPGRSPLLTTHLYYAIECSNKALLHLVAYQTVCENKKVTFLRQRQEVASQLTTLIQATQKLLTTTIQQQKTSSSTAGRLQRAHLFVVRSQEEG